MSLPSPRIDSLRVNFLESEKNRVRVTNYPTLITLGATAKGLWMFGPCILKWILHLESELEPKRRSIREINETSGPSNIKKWATFLWKIKSHKLIWQTAPTKKR